MRLNEVDENLMLALDREGVHVIDDTFLHFAPEDLGISGERTERDVLMKESRLYGILKQLIDVGLITFPREAVDQFSFYARVESEEVTGGERKMHYLKRKIEGIKQDLSTGKHFASEKDRIAQKRAHAKASRRLINVMQKNLTFEQIDPKIAEYIEPLIEGVKGICSDAGIIRDLKLGLNENDPQYRFIWNDAIIYAKALAVAFSQPASILTRDPDFLDIDKAVRADSSRLEACVGYRTSSDSQLEIVLASRGRYFVYSQQEYGREIRASPRASLQIA